MRFDLSGAVLDMAGEPMLWEAPAGASQAATFALIAMRVLSAGDERDSGEQKFACFRLGLRIHENPFSVELKAEEIAQLKALIGKRCSPLVVGRFWELLERPLPALPEPAREGCL